MIIFMIGVMCCGLKTMAAPNGIYSFITEFSVNGETWKYGERKVTIPVDSNAPVSVEYTMFFTNSQWKEYHQNLQWKLPEGVQIMYVNEHVTAVLDGEAVNVGTMTVVDSNVQILISEEYEQIIEQHDNIELRAGVVLKFEKGTYDLGEIVIVEAKEDGRANIRWNGYSVKVNKIDETEVAELLGGALFEIQEYEYSENAHEFENGQIFGLVENNVKENDTFVYEGNGFSTVKDVAALLEGSFEPGKLYYLNELRPPAGYLPAAEPTKFAFYHYTDSEKEGTLRKIQELNAEYKARYEAEGGVAAFGQETGELGTTDYNIYVKNKKAPSFRVLKLDAMTGEAISNVTFTLRIDVKNAEYSIDSYLGLENAGWTYNDLTGVLEWTQKTNDAGLLVYPEGTVPYSTAGYELVETVPDGYVGHGSSIVTKFVMDADGSIQILNGDAAAEVIDGIFTIKIENEKTADICIMKENESGQPLEGAVFAIYGPTKTDTDDTIEKDGVTYYYLQSNTSGSDGKVEFTDLRYGVYYLVEKEAPEGYQLLEDAYRVEISEDTLNDGIYELEIINSKKGVEIVATGGKGIWPYVAVAGVLLVIGTVFFLAARRREKIRRKKRAAAMRRRNEQKKKKG
ncbi:MAG: hypothetical protein IJ024_02020 [Lachnospiraceae bacterium]|nr:hypothetical protein [Lachnospiraceae bacterium]